MSSRGRNTGEQNNRVSVATQNPGVAQPARGDRCLCSWLLLWFFYLLLYLFVCFRSEEKREFELLFSKRRPRVGPRNAEKKRHIIYYNNDRKWNLEVDGLSGVNGVSGVKWCQRG